MAYSVAKAWMARPSPAIRKLQPMRLAGRRARMRAPMVTKITSNRSAHPAFSIRGAPPRGIGVARVMISRARSAAASATARAQASQPTLRVLTVTIPQGNILDIAGLGDLRGDRQEAYGHDRSGKVTSNTIVAWSVSVRGARRNNGQPRTITDTDPAGHRPVRKENRPPSCRSQRRGRRAG